MIKKLGIRESVFIILAFVGVKPFMTKSIDTNLEPRRFNCVRPDIEQFPKTFFNQNDRLNGAVMIHLLVVMYMFIALAIVCDEYFVPSLEKICKVFKIKEDIAG